MTTPRATRDTSRDARVATTPRRPSRTNPTSPTTTRRRSCRARRRAREGDRPWSSRRSTSRRARRFDSDPPPPRSWSSEGRSRGTGPRREPARPSRTRGPTRAPRFSRRVLLRVARRRGRGRGGGGGGGGASVSARRLRPNLRAGVRRARGFVRRRVSSAHGTTIVGDASRGTRRCGRRRVAALRRGATRALATVPVRARRRADRPASPRVPPRARVGPVRRGVDSSRGWCAPSPRDLRRRRPGRRVRRRHGVSPRRVRKRTARRPDAGAGVGPTGSRDGVGARSANATSEPPPRFLGPGDAVGEDAALRGGRKRDRGFDRGDGHGDFRGDAPPPVSSRRRRTTRLHRSRAVRDTQFLWIPASGLDSLASAAPRAFVSLAWRAGVRTRIRIRIRSDSDSAWARTISVTAGWSSRGVTSRRGSTVAGEPRARLRRTIRRRRRRARGTPSALRRRLERWR